MAKDLLTQLTQARDSFLAKANALTAAIKVMGNDQADEMLANIAPHTNGTHAAPTKRTYKKRRYMRHGTAQARVLEYLQQNFKHGTFTSEIVVKHFDGDIVAGTVSSIIYKLGQKKKIYFVGKESKVGHHGGGGKSIYRLAGSPMKSFNEIKNATQIKEHFEA